MPRRVRTKWFLDSGYSKHMTGEYTLLSSFKRKEGGQVTFGDNSKGNIFGYGIVSNITSSYIENVQLVDNLKHNLLSVG